MVGMPASDTTSTVAPLFDLVEQAVGLVAFVVVVVGDDAAGHADAKAVRERVQAARILGCHDVGAFHEGDQAGGRVSGVADRRGGEHDRSARNVDVGDQSVEPEFGTFRSLRGFPAFSAFSPISAI